MWCLKAKKLKFLIEFLDGTKKVQLAGKKSTASRQKKFPKGLEDFVHVFGKLTTPSVMFLKQKTQILIAHQKEDIERTQKSTATRQKKFG